MTLHRDKWRAMLAAKDALRKANPILIRAPLEVYIEAVEEVLAEMHGRLEDLEQREEG